MTGPGRPVGPAQSIGPMVFVTPEAFEATVSGGVAAVEIDAGDRHHLERVLRLRDGEAMVVCDGAGRWRPATFGHSVSVAGDVVVEREPAPVLTVAFAVVKGDRNELVAQKLTELGVDRIVPMSTERCVVRWDADRAERQRARLQKVAREASMQCRRPWLPTVEPVQSFSSVVASAAGDAGVVLADAWGDPATAAVHTILVGPEGGWSDAERGAGLAAVRLGSHVLRAETAAIVAATVLTGLRSGVVAPASA